MEQFTQAYLVVQRPPGNDWVLRVHESPERPDGYTVQLPMEKMECHLGSLGRLVAAYDLAMRICQELKGNTNELEVFRLEVKGHHPSDEYYMAIIPDCTLAETAHLMTWEFPTMMRVAETDPSTFQDRMVAVDRAVGLVNRFRRTKIP